MTEIQTATAARIVAAQQAIHTAQAAFEQAVRAAVDTKVMKVADIARALNIKNRAGIYAILGRGADGGEPAAPALPPVVYLRGAGCGDTVWQCVTAAMHARGWATVRVRTSAWHLSRGGVPVVFADFSSTGPDGLYAKEVTVGRVRARYQDDIDTTTVADLLTTRDHARLFGTPWLNEVVEVEHTDMDLPLLNGGPSPRPERHDPDAVNNMGAQGAWVLDEQALARLVAAALAS